MAGLDRDAAQKLDEDLMSAEGGFSLDQLMELAGLSVAMALYSDKLRLEEEGGRFFLQSSFRKRFLPACRFLSSSQHFLHFRGVHFSHIFHIGNSVCKV